MFVFCTQKVNLSLVGRLYKDIVEFSHTDPDVFSVHSSDHIHKVDTEDYAFINDRVSLLKARESNCDLVVASEVFYLLSYSIGLPKGSPHRELLSNTYVRCYTSSYKGFICEI